MYVCLSVWRKRCFFFFFVSLWNRAISWPSVLHDKATKRCSSIFGLGPLTPKIYFPKFAKKLPISRLVWKINWRCLGLLGGFRGWPIQWNHAKCCGADPCCHGNEIRARCGDPSAYRLVCWFNQHSLIVYWRQWTNNECCYFYFYQEVLWSGIFLDQFVTFVMISRKVKAYTLDYNLYLKLHTLAEIGYTTSDT